MQLSFSPHFGSNNLKTQFDRSCQNAANYIIKNIEKNKQSELARVTTLLGCPNGLNEQHSMLGATALSRLRDILDEHTLANKEKSTLKLMEEGELDPKLLPKLESALGCRDEPVNAFKKGELTFQSEAQLAETSRTLLSNARAASESILQTAKEDADQLKADTDAEITRALDDAQGSIRSLQDEGRRLEQKNQLAQQRLQALASPERIATIQHHALFQAQKVTFSAEGKNFLMRRSEIDLYDDLVKLAGNGQLNTPNDAGAIELPNITAPQMQSIVAFRRGETIENIQAGHTAALLIDNPEMLAYCRKDNIQNFRQEIARAARTLMFDASSNDHKTPLSKAKSDINKIVDSLTQALASIRPDEIASEDIKAIEHYIRSLTRDNYVNHFDLYAVPNEDNRMRGRHWNAHVNSIIDILKKIDWQVSLLQSVGPPNQSSLQ